jgi:hypothetical protein
VEYEKRTHNNGLFDIFVQAAHAAAKRRRRLCKRAQPCPKCLTRQVQLIDCRPLGKMEVPEMQARVAV